MKVVRQVYHKTLWSICDIEKSIFYRFEFTAKRTLTRLNVVYTRLIEGDNECQLDRNGVAKKVAVTLVVNP